MGFWVFVLVVFVGWFVVRLGCVGGWVWADLEGV